VVKYTFCIADKSLSQSNPKVCASNEFEAPNDIDATAIAMSIFNSCDDIVCDYWLWGPANRLVATNLRKQVLLPLKDLPGLVTRRQKNALELEEALQQGYDCLARSRSLLNATVDLREALKVR
jgi:hypothetical protein